MKNWKIGIIVFSILLGGFFIFPKYQEGIALKTKNKTLQLQLALKIKEIKRLDESQLNLAKTDSSLFAKIPRDEMQESIIRTIAKILDKHSFELQGGVGFSKGFNSDVNAAEIKTSFSVTGPKNKLIQLVSAFEKNERFFGIEKLSVGIFSKNQSQMVSLPISLFSFFQEK